MKKISNNGPIISKKPLSNERGVTVGKIGKTIGIKKAESVQQQPNTKSPPKNYNVDIDARTRGLKFPDEPIPKNPLQVGLAAKHHSEQQTLFNVMR